MDDERLERAEGYVAEGERRVADQRALVAELERDGHDTTSSRRLLMLLEGTLEQMIAYRHWVRRLQPAAVDGVKVPLGSGSNS